MKFFGLYLRFPFNHKEMPAYALTYIAFRISLYFMAFAVVSVDGFFMGISLNIVACLQDLTDMISEIDNVLTDRYGRH